MAMGTQAGFDLINTYVHLEAGGGATPEEVGDDFWMRIAHRPYEGMRLVAVIRIADDSPTWEMHPAGDELLYLLSGAIDFVMQDGDSERRIELRAGAACIVPRGAWHRSIVRTPGDLLFITPGEGTQQRPV
jgi:mannose-6-phosphate isomerase-like protein (cupin superfamily)